MAESRIVPTGNQNTASNRVIRVPPLFPWQSDYLALTQRFKAVCVGRRSGKSTALAVKLLCGPKGLARGFNVALMAHKDVGLAAVERELIKLLGPLLKPLKQKNRYIFTPNGAEFHEWTLGNKKTSMEAGRGEHYGTIVVDEAAYCFGLWDAFEASIEPTLIDDRGEITFAGTPKGTKNDFTRICQHKVDALVTGSLANCNPLEEYQEYFEKKRRAALRNQIDPRVFRQEYCGEIVDMGDCVVTQEMIQYLDLEPNLPDPDNWTIHFGVDLAFTDKHRERSDWTAIVVVARNISSGAFFVCDVQRMKFTNPLFILQIIRQMANVWRPTKIAVEKTPAQGAIVAMWSTIEEGVGLPFVGLSAEKSKDERFGPTAQLYAQRRIFHARTDKELDEEDEDKMTDEEKELLYARRGYDREGNQRIARYKIPQYFEDELTLFPIAEHDDMCDALAYAIMSFGSYWDVDTTSGSHWDRPNEPPEDKPMLWVA